MEQKIIKIFLASSNELSDDREKFGNFVRRINQKIFNKQGLHIDLFEWEDEDSGYRGRRKQDEYNEQARLSNMFMALFFTKGGNFTIEEFEVALDEYGKKKSPIIYVYFKDLPEEKEWLPELKAFTKRLGDIGLFWTSYSNQDSLRLHFLYQLLIGENELIKLKVDDGTVKLGNMPDAEMSNLSFASGYKDYQRISAELGTLPKAIANVRKFLDEYPDNEYLQGELQKKLNRYNNLKEEFTRLQQTLFETSQRIAKMQRENLSDKLRRAIEAFESGNMEKANELLDEIAIEAEIQYSNQKRELVHQDIEAFLLQAKTKMVEVNIPIEERIKEVHSIYAKADQWAEDSELPDDKLDGLLKDYSQFLYDYGMYNKAEPVYLRLVSLREGTLGKEHPDTATTYSAIGQVYDNLGNYPKAFEYYQKALNIREKAQGMEHPDTAESYNNIGAVYADQGDYTKALEYYFMALDIREKVLGKEHPDTATSYNNIGAVYDSQGDYIKALEYYFKDLAISEKVLGKEHPSTATSYNNIGTVYDDQGDYTKALEYYFKALDIREKVLGKEHPDTATSYNNIGMTYINLKDYTKALEYLQKAFDIRKQKLGSDHPYTKGTKEGLEFCKLMKALQDGASDDERLLISSVI
ncbi:MAG: tetratricopeptide repeat protein [Prevotella sp.]|nr:tetratricopeptide repeat protein [Prevotella sp.]